MNTSEKWWLNILKKPRNSPYSRQMFQSFKFNNTHRIFTSLFTCAVGGGLVYLAFNRVMKEDVAKTSTRDYSEPAARKSHFKFPIQNSRSPPRKVTKLNLRERRFIKFASVEYKGQLYMTPRDFLDVVVAQEPRPRLKCRILTDADLKGIRDAALYQKSKECDGMFHTLHDTGIVSYSEYLFLLSVLTRPHAGYHIIFNMFDRDGNSRVDKFEYLNIERVMSRTWMEKRGLSDGSSASRDAVDDDEGLQKRHSVDTTLLTFFFGKDGTSLLSYEMFHAFMSNLQTEVLVAEFNEYAKGDNTLTEVDFVKALVGYTYMDSDKLSVFEERIRAGITEEKGITFEEFYRFCGFINHLNDFTMGVRLSRLLDENLSEDMFHHIVKCISKDVSPYVLHVLFVAFNENGEGKLDVSEFLSIMRHRRNRLFTSQAKRTLWKTFKLCVGEEIRKTSYNARIKKKKKKDKQTETSQLTKILGK